MVFTEKIECSVPRSWDVVSTRDISLLALFSINAVIPIIASNELKIREYLQLFKGNATNAAIYALSVG